MTTIGSLFTGYGGLDHAVEAVTGGRTIWRSDIDPGACKVIAHHWPDEPNLGDITAVDWSAVERVDVLAGGFPCQDVSAAGKRAGLIRYGEGNRSGLWAEMARAIDILRPSLVVAENVRGLLSAKADAHPDVFDCLACVADTSDKPMRALGAVLGDLAALGYDAAWRVVRASDVGAPHQRARVFIIAWPADTAGPRLEGTRPEPARGGPERGDSDVARMTTLPTPRSQNAEDRNQNVWPRPLSEPQNLENALARVPFVAAMLPTPSRSDGTGGPGASGREGGMNLRTAVTLLATPTTAIRTGGAPQDSKGKRDLRLDITHLPTPRATDGTNGGPNQRGSSGDVALPAAVQPERWGKYADAVARWEALTRPAPEPTETSPRGGQRLSPAFVEWMMGLPAGHVTNVPGLSRNEQLKMLGNGVVPQQAEHALRGLLSDVAATVAA